MPPIQLSPIQQPIQPSPVKQCGFTLIELIIVITLLGIISLVTVGFISSSVQGFADLTRRDQLSAAARIAVERMAREVRNALPNSIRVTAGGDCLEFIPTSGASRYLSVPTSTATPANNFQAVAFALAPNTQNSRIAVYPIDSNRAEEPRAATDNPIYDIDNHAIISPLLTSSGAALAPVPTPASGAVTVTLNSSHTFPADSPSRRFFVVQEPVSFCVVGSDLYRFQGTGVAAQYTYSNNQPSAAQLFANLAEPNRVLLASDIAMPPNNTPFRFVDAVLQRNGLVLFDMFVVDPNIVGARPQENVQVQFAVQVRNVP